MNYQKLIYSGNLTRDPEMNVVNDSQLTKFAVANNRKVKGKEYKCFLECVAWGKTAEMIADYFKKGDAIFLDGILQFDQWEKDGVKHSKHWLKVENFQFVGKKGDRNADAPF